MIWRCGENSHCTAEAEPGLAGEGREGLTQERARAAVQSLVACADEVHEGHCVWLCRGGRQAWCWWAGVQSVL